MSLNLVCCFRHTGPGILLALFLVTAGVKPAAANVIYDFSLAANGAVGAIDIQLNVSSFLPIAGLQVDSLAGPLVTSFFSGTPVGVANSVVGIDVQAGDTLFGISLATTSGSNVFFTANYPGDFFVFGRTPNQVGTFFSLAGNVFSNLALNTATPTATLVVTSTNAVPEPATTSILGLGVLCTAGWHQMRRRF